MKSMLQVTDTLDTAARAQDVLTALQIQDGYEFGRILSPSPAKPGFRVQAFLRDDGSYIEGALDNVKRVMVPEGMERLLGADTTETERLRSVTGHLYDPTHESQLADVQSGTWISRHDLVLDPAIQGDERQRLLTEQEEFLRRRL